ncbi:MAG: fatty acid CoA ligase family protein [Planctomycetaceae bacterium]
MHRLSSANIARRLTEAARAWPERLAVVAPDGQHADGRQRYKQWTFCQLDDDSDRLARGLIDYGVGPGKRLVLFVPFSYEFIALTFAIYKTAATIVLIDPGMGRTNIFECLKEVRPDGFVAIPIVHAARVLKGRMFSSARLNVTVGRRWFWRGRTYESLLKVKGGQRDAHAPLPGETSRPTDPAAIIFTSGSTGAPKGVLYEHGMFDAQVELIQNYYGIEPGEVDLPGFPLFGLFNAAMGVTTVIPDMDPTRPAQVDPRKILTAINDWQVTQAFGSPAFWNRVGRYCEANDVTLPSIHRGLSAGGPVPTHVLRRMTRVFTRSGADLYTPYGATESLPVASIGGREVLERTSSLTAVGKGTCVGRTFPGVDVRIIRITEGPIGSLSAAVELPAGEIGEIVVRGRSVTREYFQRPEANALAKIPLLDSAKGEGNAVHEQDAKVLPTLRGHEPQPAIGTSSLDAQPSAQDSPGFYHRIGDVGYLDADGLLWFCGRKAHIVETAAGRMFSVCCEAIFDEHPRVYRSALVGLGPRPNQTPVIVVEPEEGAFPESSEEQERLREELLRLAERNTLTNTIRDIRFHRSLPVDTRHNVKINREALAVWAAGNGG